MKEDIRYYTYKPTFIKLTFPEISAGRGVEPDICPSLSLFEFIQTEFRVEIGRYFFITNT